MVDTLVSKTTKETTIWRPHDSSMIAFVDIKMKMTNWKGKRRSIWSLKFSIDSIDYQMMIEHPKCGRNTDRYKVMKSCLNFLDHHVC